MKDLFLIRKPWITEKASRFHEEGKYVFMVKPNATKNEIKKAVKDLYRVEATSVNIIRRQGKPKRFRNTTRLAGGYKKAVVTLKPGEKIDLGR